MSCVRCPDLTARWRSDQELRPEQGEYLVQRVARRTFVDEVRHATEIERMSTKREKRAFDLIDADRWMIHMRPSVPRSGDGHVTAV